ncbi:DNA replication terminus site-binding protein [Providencia sp. PROV255]|uniref:DNA replication terminus site-binding protein n=1 Tax=Providencia sp. PROV255 TaxID=2949943 RepID=UPI0023492BE8|nr:DNA replication terminus site-binding protein [Providencia sp. PROV255]
MNIAETFRQMEDNLALLKRVLAEKSPLYARVCVVPPVADGDENLPVESIEPILLYGAQAIEHTQKCFSDLYIKDGLSQKSTRRTAGLLWYDDETPAFTAEVMALVTAINDAKQSIQTHIISHFSSQNARFTALHNACPGVMTLHLYRQIRAWHNADIQSVRFSWQRKSLLRIPDKAKLLASMQSDIVDNSDVALPVGSLVQRIANTPEDKLRLRRPAKIQPVANIQFRSEEEGEPPTIKGVTALMPYIIIQNQRLEIKPLQNYAPRDILRSKDRLATEVIGTFHGETIEMLIGS